MSNPTIIGTEDGYGEWLDARGLTVPTWARGAALLTATARLEDLCRRRLLVQYTASVEVAGADDAILLIPEMASVTAVKIDGVAEDATTYRVLPLNETPKLMIERKFGVTWPNPDTCTITVEGTLGYADPVPAALIEACYLLATASLLDSDPGVVQSESVGEVSTTYATNVTASRIEALVKAHRRAKL